VQKIIFFLALVAIGCDKKVEKSEIYYFDLKGLVTSQIGDLNQKQPRLLKNWQIGSKKESKEFEKTDWNKELEVFIEADINKSGLKNSYVTEKIGFTEKFKLKEGENAPIKYLIVKKDSLGMTEQVELESGMDNYLFESKTKLKLILKDNKLQSYNAEGYQKLFFGKADSTKIEGIIL